MGSTMARFEVFVKGGFATVDAFIANGHTEQLYLMSIDPWFPKTIEDLRNSIINLYWGTFLTAIEKFTETAINGAIEEFYVITGSGEFYVIKVVGFK
jgi:hypothetical protein